MSNEILDELNASFVSGEREFKGEALAPYTEGSRLLLLQVRDENDSSIFFVWSFLYLHILLRKNRKEAIKLAWNRDLLGKKSLITFKTRTKTTGTRQLPLSLKSLTRLPRHKLRPFPKPEQRQAQTTKASGNGFGGLPTG